MVAVPAATPVIDPVETMVTTPGELDVQPPPLVASESVVEVPAQMVVVPVIEAGGAGIVITFIVVVV